MRLVRPLARRVCHRSESVPRLRPRGWEHGEDSRGVAYRCPARPYLFGGRVRLGRVGAAFATRLPPRPNPCEPSPCAALASDPSDASLRAGSVSIASLARAAILDFRSGLDPASEVVRVRDLSSIFRTASPFFRVLATFLVFSRSLVFFPSSVVLLPLVWRPAGGVGRRAGGRGPTALDTTFGGRNRPRTVSAAFCGVGLPRWPLSGLTIC